MVVVVQKRLILNPMDKTQKGPTCVNPPREAAAWSSAEIWGQWKKNFWDVSGRWKGSDLFNDCGKKIICLMNLWFLHICEFEYDLESLKVEHKDDPQGIGDLDTICLSAVLNMWPGCLWCHQGLLSRRSSNEQRGLLAAAHSLSSRKWKQRHGSSCENRQLPWERNDVRPFPRAVKVFEAMLFGRFWLGPTHLQRQSVE